MILNREDLEKQELKKLAPYAIKSAKTKGRIHSEDPDPFRLCFQKDKERVIHSKAFRRLARKTQVLTAGEGDHFRTRITHTLEVAQISRGIARILGLNEDLAGVIALAHDLGHPPFGHTGEEILDELMQKYDLNFEHNQQSRRIVQELECPYPGFKGLNLCKEVLEGLIKHQTAWDQAGKSFEKGAHLEAQVVNIADEIAYTNHDLDDGLRLGAFKIDDLEKFTLWKQARKHVFDHYGDDLNTQKLVSRIISTMFSMMIDDFCEQTDKNLQANKINSIEDVKRFKGNLAEFSQKMKDKIAELRQFLFENFYFHPEVRRAQEKGQKMIKEVFKYLMKNPGSFLEDDFDGNKKDLAILVKDYIAGMTDDFLIDFYLSSRT
ncbi:deoxyguanosinetriphosphate triphosphohydrolase [Patescibacteria group bacterium]